MVRHTSISRRRELSSRNNAKCEIDNPLAHLSLSNLYKSAEAFAKKVNPNTPDIAFWKNAALVARYQQIPHLCNRISTLTESQKASLREQRNLGFWQQPKSLRITIVTLCLAAIIQGWVQTGLNGANLTWPMQLGLTSEPGPPKTTQEVWIFAAINSILYFSASILGCWASDPVQSLYFGRRGAIFFSACLCLAGAIGSGFSKTWPQLLGCRIVLGAAMGAKASVTPIYGAEISPPHLRGALVMNWQLFDAFGIFLGFSANLIVANTGDNSWRYEVASAVIPTIALLSLVWTIPESGRWLLKKGRYADAFTSFCAIRETSLQAAAELFYANAQIQAELHLLNRVKIDVENMDNEEKDVSKPMQVNAPRTPTQSFRSNSDDAHRRRQEDEVKERTARGCMSFRGHLKRIYNKIIDQKDDVDLDDYQRCAKSTYYFKRIWQLVRIPRIRRATTAALVMMVGQQLCGINIIQFYSTTFFRDPNIAPNSLRGPWISWGFGLANFVFTFPIYFFIDRRGRRFLLLSSYPGMILSILAASQSYNIDDNTKRTAVVVFFMLTFVFFYSWGQGPVPFAYSSEVFPMLNREAGMSFAVFVNLFGAGILAFFVPQLAQALSPSSPDNELIRVGECRLLEIFIGLNVVALILIFFFVPETAGATLGSDGAQGLNVISLEELNYIFNVETSKHIRYQIIYIVPWAWDMLRWKFRRHIMRKTEKRPEDPDQLYTWVQITEVNELGEEIESAR